MPKMLAPATIVRVSTAGALLWALADHSYDYYILLRWLVFGTAAFTGYEYMRRQLVGWAWGFALVAALFNPFFPVHLPRGTWAVLDIGVAALLLLSAVRLRSTAQTPER
jgi:hypothetical protein